MALRTIRLLGDEILTKKCREVKVLSPRIQQLIEDMLETMYDANGVGLAAPQVGVLRRIVVIDIGDGPLIMINPVILETEGEQTGDEGCLSFPGKAGQVTRPNYVKARYFDENMEEYEIEAEELLARAICHELDHLEGHMYVEKVEGEIHEMTYAEPEPGEDDEETGQGEDDAETEQGAETE
ncbi:MAG: peptide deformylase [Clostridiales bacterium]|nr:peptide deformylase [Clostridiales bacterium]